MSRSTNSRWGPWLRRQTTRWRIAIATLCLACGVGAPSSYGVFVLTNGHVDGVGIAFEGGEFEPHVHVHQPNDSGAPEENEPEEVFFYVPSNAKTTVPGNPSFSFLGSPGDDVWILPQSTPGLNILFLGMGAEEVDAGTFVGGEITVTLTNITGPGNFFLWQTDGFGEPTAYMNTANGLSALDAFVMPEGGHAHMNWGFTTTGIYELQFIYSGTLVEGDEFVQSEIHTWTFGVETFPVPEPSAAMLLGTGGLVLMRLVRRRR